MGHTLAAVPAYLPVLFEITYMVASCGIKTLDIKLSQMDLGRATGGIYVDRRKGSVSNHIEWSDRLFAAYHAAMKHRQEHKIADINASLILSGRSKRLTRSGLDSAMQRLKREMKERGLEDSFWTLQMLKTKGQPDVEKDRISDLKSEAMRNGYNRKIERHKPAH